MRPRAYGWFRAALLGCASALAAACGSDPAPVSPVSCSPACSAGYTCSAGNCVALCNPACGAGETCVVRSGATTCVSGGADGGGEDVPSADVPAGDGSMDDVPQPMDMAPPTDGPPPGDAPPPTDGPPPTDAPAPTDAAMRPPCGMTGQPCCNGFGCTGANACNAMTMRCEAYTPESNECTSTGTCPSGQVCSLARCGAGDTRVCLRCLPAPTGMGVLAAGAACGGTITGTCSTGICANRLCTYTCVPGAAGDAACRARDPNTFCGEFAQWAVNDAGMRTGPTTTFGACVRGCQRDADCPTTHKCGLTRSDLDDRLNLVCRVPFGTLTPGATCPLMPTNTRDPSMFCQSSQCFAAGMSTTMGYCAAFCATDADCPGPTYACREVPFFRPSELSTQPIRICERR